MSLAITVAVALGEWLLACCGVILTLQGVGAGDLGAFGNGTLAFLAAFGLRRLAGERRAHRLSEGDL